MMCFNLSTNVNIDRVDTSEFLSEATTILTEMMGKSKQHIMVVLKGSVPMSCGKTRDPIAYAKLISVGGLGPEVNIKLSALPSDLFEKELNVPKDRFFMKIFESPGHSFSFNSTTLNHL